MDQRTFKRKFRYTLEGNLPAGKFEQTFVNVSVRSNVLEEVSPTDSITVKQPWENFTTKIPDIDEKLRECICSSHVLEEHSCPPQEKLGVFTLRLYDGCGDLMESWELLDAYVANFSCNEDSSLDLFIKYKTVNYKVETLDIYSTSRIGMGPIGSHNKVKCPKCAHEFVGFPISSINF